MYIHGVNRKTKGRGHVKYTWCIRSYLRSRAVHAPKIMSKTSDDFAQAKSQSLYVGHNFEKMGHMCKIM